MKPSCIFNTPNLLTVDDIEQSCSLALMGHFSPWINSFYGVWKC